MGSEVIQRSVTIEAPPPAVWEALTNPDVMPKWMGEQEMAVQVTTTWTVGGPIHLEAFHHARFEAKGIVLRFEPFHAVRYSQLNSISRLPDVPESYSVLDFVLVPEEHGTKLTLTITGFPTEAIFKHLDFYWRVTLTVLKKFVEDQRATKKAGS